MILSICISYTVPLIIFDIKKEIPDYSRISKQIFSSLQTTDIAVIPLQTEIDYCVFTKRGPSSPKVPVGMNPHFSRTR